MLRKPAETTAPLHPLLAERWSPRSFDNSADLPDEAVLSLLEAARWAPSSNNGQPWRFAVARRGEHLFTELAAALAGFNQHWAPRAAALVVAAVETVDADQNPRKSADFDLGLAVAALCTQATALGLVTHQMGGFSAAKVRTALNLDETVKPVVVIAVGPQGPANLLEPELRSREEGPRSRRPLSEIVLRGLPPA